MGRLPVYIHTHSSRTLFSHNRMKNILLGKLDDITKPFIFVHILKLYHLIQIVLVVVECVYSILQFFISRYITQHIYYYIIKNLAN